MAGLIAFGVVTVGGCASASQPDADPGASAAKITADDQAVDAPTGSSTTPTSTPTTTSRPPTSTTTTGPVATSTSTLVSGTTSSTTSTSTSTVPTTSASTTTMPPPPSTACTDVAQVADSTGLFLTEARYVDGAANTIGERYRSVGVERWIDDSSGGRSIRERSETGQTNAVEAADAIRRSGFDGCWVIMVGTNDAANVAAGANLGFEERILRLLFVLGDDPVLWVDAATSRARTAYRNEHMRAWNEQLYRIAAERDNVRVVRWSEQVRSEWYVADGVHVGTEGRIWRAAIVASALAEEFPATPAA